MILDRNGGHRISILVATVLAAGRAGRLHPFRLLLDDFLIVGVAVMMLFRVLISMMSMVVIILVVAGVIVVFVMVAVTVSMTVVVGLLVFRPFHAVCL